MTYKFTNFPERQTTPDNFSRIFRNLLNFRRGNYQVNNAGIRENNNLLNVRILRHRVYR